MAAPVPKGTLTSHVFDQSKVFPGTIRRYWVYVPKQYDGSKPACLFVVQDGWNPIFTQTMDQLIATHQMPVTIGVFITPGAVPAPNPTSIPRGNRSFEYNSLGDDYERFLVNELLPTIVNEEHLNISTDPNDRSIGGGSSGASIAWTVAWEHPEQFRRVFSVSGAFPFSRGACYSVLVRKEEAKPIRVFMHVGRNDMYNTSGDLWMDNERMHTALVFAGYDVNYIVSDGRHMDQYKQMIPVGLQWLWRDYPAPIVSGSSPPRVNDTILPNEPWNLVGQGYQQITSMTVDPQGAVYVADAPANKLYKTGADGKVAPYLDDAGEVTGLATGTDGRLYGISAATGNLLSFDANGQKHTIATGLPGHGLFATRQGGFYVTIPGPFGTAQSQVWFVSPTGEKKLVDTGLKAATGIADSTDDWQLYVADGRSHFVYAYQVNNDGSLSSKEHYFWLHVPDNADDAGADGLAVSKDGTVYVATRMGIQTNDDQGHNQCILLVPGGRVTAIAFGGPSFDTLYAACGDKIYARKVNEQGVQVFQPPAKPAGGKL
jgi:sugar lactone lactonase YvrE/enterochelin esterase-like enzyme